LEVAAFSISGFHLSDFICHGGNLGDALKRRKQTGFTEFVRTLRSELNPEKSCKSCQFRAGNPAANEGCETEKGEWSGQPIKAGSSK
jgi:hypothetical protein